MSSYSIEDVETPEDVIALSEITNYWVDTSEEAKFFFVDANFAILLLFATIDLYNPTTLIFLAVSFTFFSILAFKKVKVLEFIETGKTLLCLKKAIRE